MEEFNKKVEDTKETVKQNLLSYDDKEQQALFTIFGIQLTAPKGLKYPRLVYISFIIINLILLILIKNIISN